VQLYLARQFDQAIEQSHKTLDLDPNFAVAYALLAQAHSAKGQDREALSDDEKYAALSRDSAMSLAHRGYVQARLGDRNQALQALNQLTATSQQTYTSAFAFAVPMSASRQNQAFAWLESLRRASAPAYLRQESSGIPAFDLRYTDLPVVSVLSSNTKS
jgi:tetratricopeptide (TPR) repeat protein